MGFARRQGKAAASVSVILFMLTTLNASACNGQPVEIDSKSRGRNNYHHHEMLRYSEEISPEGFFANHSSYLFNVSDQLLEYCDPTYNLNVQGIHVGCYVVG